MKKFVNLAVLAVAAIGGYLLVDVLFKDTKGPSQLSIAQVEAEVLSQEGGALYEIIKVGFPEAFGNHLINLQTIANNRSLNTQQAQNAAFEQSRLFSSGLRRENAHHMANAPREDLIAVQEATLAMVMSVADNPALCARVAATGMQTLSASEVSRLDADLIFRSAIVNFETMIAGRDNPQTYAPITDTDWQQFYDEWLSADTTSADAINAFVQDDIGNAEAYCEGAISFQQRLINDTSPLGQRMLSEMTRRMAAN